jgi:tetratricopeptide (TPR) repeat protein
LSLLFVISSPPALFGQEETKDPVAIFNQGQDAHEKGDLKTAVDRYRQALELFPEFAEAEYQLAHAYFQQGQTADAEKSFRRALELRADWTLPMTGLASILVEKNQFAEAEKLIMKGIELDEQNAPAYVVLADLRLKTKAPAPVLREVLSKLQFLTEKAKATAATAKTSLKRALLIEPNNKTALAELVESSLAANDAAGALENAKNLLKLAPHSSNAKFLLARALAVAGQTEDSLKIFDSIENISPEMRAFRDKIVANTSVDTAELEKQLEKEPGNPAVSGRLCSLLRVEDPLKALNYCKAAAIAEPNNLSHSIGYGAALVRAKQYGDAVTLFRKIIANAPDNYTAHANLAVALFQLKRYPEAKLEYLWLAEKQPELPITYYFLGIIHDYLTEYLDAMANYQQFLRLADAEQNKLEIEKVNLRLPSLQKQIKDKKGKKNE